MRQHWNNVVVPYCHNVLNQHYKVRPGILFWIWKIKFHLNSVHNTRIGQARKLNAVISSCLNIGHLSFPKIMLSRWVHYVILFIYDKYIAFPLQGVFPFRKPVWRVFLIADSKSKCCMIKHANITFKFNYVPSNTNAIFVKYNQFMDCLLHCLQQKSRT